MMLILEYAPYGDLLGYLRKSRGLEDKYYSSPESCQQEVTSYDLLAFAQQISAGMSFLASKKVYHSFSSLTQSPNDKLGTSAVPFVLQLQANGWKG